MSEMIQLESLPVETLAEMANEAAAASLAQWEECKVTGSKAVEHAARCGRALQAIKAQLPHGKWASWVEESFPFGIRRSQQFMEIAKAHARALLTNASSFQDALRLMEDSPEKQARKAEREAKKLETPPRSLAPATPAPPVSSGIIRNENPPSQPQRPAWLADPDELDRPEETDLPPLPRTNTHHTSANRRTPDARETDRAGIVCPDDPRGLQDGGWYVWSEARNRLLPVTDEDVLRRFDQMRRERAPKAGQVMPVVPWPPKETPVVEPAHTTTPAVEHRTASVSNKRFIPPTADEVSAYSDEISAGVDGQQFVDFYESKGWMIGKNKMKDWRAAVRTWKRSESQRGSKITTAVRSNRNWDEEIPEWKPTE